MNDKEDNGEVQSLTDYLLQQGLPEGGPTLQELQRKRRRDAVHRFGRGLLIALSIPVMMALSFAAWIVVLFVASLFS